MFPILQIGPLAIQTPGLFLLLGLWLGLNLAEKHAATFGIKPKFIYDLVIAALIAGVIAGRVAYIARFPEAFLSSPLSVLSLNPLLFDLQGGILVSLLAGLIVIARQRLAFWSVLDALTPLFAVMTVAFGFSHLASGTAFGAPSALPWAITLWGEQRHPSQVYEILAGLVILITILLINRERVQRTARLRLQSSGNIFLTFLALSAGARLFLEAFRGDSTLIFYQLRAAQVAAWGILALSFILLGTKRSTRETSQPAEVPAEVL